MSVFQQNLFFQSIDPQYKVSHPEYQEFPQLKGQNYLTKIRLTNLVVLCLDCNRTKLRKIKTCKTLLLKILLPNSNSNNMV